MCVDYGKDKESDKMVLISERRRKCRFYSYRAEALTNMTTEEEKKQRARTEKGDAGRQPP